MSRDRIDVHTHYLGGVVDRLMASAPPATGGFRVGKWTTHLALEVMDRHDIATQVLSFPLDVSGRMDEQQAAHALDELGLDGVVLPSNAGGRYFGQPYAIYSGVFLRHPGLTLILAHGGGMLRTLYYETAIASGPHSLLPVLQCTGPDHVLFGTDWPAAPEPAVVDMVEQFVAFDAYSEPERVAVERGNARRLFPRLA